MRPMPSFQEGMRKARPAAGTAASVLSSGPFSADAAVHGDRCGPVVHAPLLIAHPQPKSVPRPSVSITPCLSSLHTRTVLSPRCIGQSSANPGPSGPPTPPAPPWPPSLPHLIVCQAHGQVDAHLLGHLHLLVQLQQQLGGEQVRNDAAELVARGHQLEALVARRTAHGHTKLGAITADDQCKSREWSRAWVAA